MLGKKQVVVAALVVALGLAIYLNWQFSLVGDELQQTGLSASSQRYGDSTFVNASLPALPESGTTEVNAQPNPQLDEGTKAYFATARENRLRTREEAIDVLKDMLAGARTDEAVQTQALAASAKLAEEIETEGRVENLIVAKGFADCMVYIDGEAVTVVVPSGDLVQSEVMQIAEIVTANTGIPSTGITIVPVQ